MGKYFGTDGFRGKANEILTSDKAYKIGKFLGSRKKNAKIVIGKDTRKSSYMFEYAIASGASSVGANVYLMHVTTTPSINYVMNIDEFDYGVMITASHNPFYDNGIKIFNCDGDKLNDDEIKEIEEYIDSDYEIELAQGKDVGTINDFANGRNRYIGYLISLAKYSFKGFKIGLDTANGSSWMIAKSVFEALGAKVYIIGNEPNGVNINLDCGSTQIANLRKLVMDNQLDIGFAFDGDADRCISVDNFGNIVDGDKILYLLACKLKREGCLTNNTVVGTLMSNSGLEKSLNDINVKMVRTNVGDRYIFEEMMKNDYSLGGENSGHIIIRKFATTGDGILTALIVMEELIERKESLYNLVKKVVLYPQVTLNIQVENKDKIIQNKVIQAYIQEENKMLDGNGRILIRKSGTEPVVRIMTECINEKLCNEEIDRALEIIKKEGLL